MRSFLLFALLIQAYVMGAQTGYIKAFGDSVAVIRMDEQTTKKYQKKSSMLVQAVQNLERELDNYKKSVEDVRYIEHPETSKAYLTLIERNEPKFDFSTYATEIKFYENYSVRYKALKKAEADSIGQANKTKHLHDVAENKRKRDSISNVHDEELKLYRSSQEPSILPKRPMLFIGQPQTALTDLQFYLQEDEMSLASIADKSSFKNRILSTSYEPKIQHGDVRKILTLKATFDNTGNIATMQVEGHWDLVIKLFVSYWDTDLDFDDAKKKETVVVNNVNERIALTLNPMLKKGTINITNRK